MTNDELVRAETLLGALALRDVALGPLTTYRVGGAAALMVIAEHEGHLEMIREAVTDTSLPVLVVGRGSNMLVADRGFAGIVVTLSGVFGELQIIDNWVRAGGAMSLPVLARKTAAAGLTGLEWAVGIPGSVGGAIRMNAGGHGSQTIERLRRCRFVDLLGGQDGTVDVEQLHMTYRHSSVADNHVVVWGEYELEYGDADAATTRISEIVKWRREHQPGGHNAGSVFVNPPNDSAGRLIDAAGLRGFRIGTAEVSQKHANFIQSDDGGTAADVVAVMRHVRQTIETQFGIELRTEIRLIGFSDEELGALR